MKNKFYFILSLSFLILACDDESNETIIENPEACYSVSASNAKVGESIEFYNCSQNATHFSWEFGDEITSNLKEPTHSFLKQGVYEVKLLAGKDKNEDGILDQLDDPDMFSSEIIINPNHLSAKITIWSTADWTVATPDYHLATNAVVKFYKEYPENLSVSEPDYIFHSDENGQIRIYDNEISAVCFIVEKNEESNIVNDYLIEGLFANQSEIDRWAYIEGATIGSYKYLDLNGDGVVNEMDKAPYEPINISLEETNEKVVYIGK